ncbi:MAG: polyhydroxyalkanoic acid system family protein [Sphingomicrobium sp.]
MSQPIEVDLPHNLGREEARRRIAANIGGLHNHIPGGADVTSSWTGDRLDLGVAAMGERIQGTLEVEDNRVRVRLALPGMLGMFGGLIAGALKSQGGLLLEDRSKG